MSAREGRKKEEPIITRSSYRSGSTGTQKEEMLEEE